MGVFIALFFIVYVDYIKQLSKNNFVEWDVKTITAGDYTVEFDITKKMYENFCNTVYNASTMSASKASAFRDWFRTEIENRLT